MPEVGRRQVNGGGEEGERRKQSGGERGRSKEERREEGARKAGVHRKCCEHLCTRQLPLPTPHHTSVPFWHCPGTIPHTTTFIIITTSSLLPLTIYFYTINTTLTSTPYVPTIL
ncbi:hypothetical protein Pcinc_016472 [Petrolisthes cinctipes]|uniref:Uncharacterized protein n=1 Tax=Petrolisthes cinctipes TaxID=88211 RepID=A0AAE1FS97_PETCI|nr:hypothetical protein Pcinc_016472 [Petrolisthes cinctipes]